MTWDGFLKSLETEGGKMLVVITILVFIVGVFFVLIETKHTPQEAGRAVAIGAVGNLLGILYGYLKSAGPRNP